MPALPGVAFPPRRGSPEAAWHRAFLQNLDGPVGFHWKTRSPAVRDFCRTAEYLGGRSHPSRRVAVTKTHEPTLAERIREATGVDVTKCYQCGKCTAGCPMARYMDLAPSQVMRLVQIGDGPARERLLTCKTLWSCAGCLTCTQRCPKDLDPAAVMDALREMSFREGKVPHEQKKVLAFHRSFLKNVEYAGRMSEVPLTSLYKLSSLDLFSDVLLAPVMLAKGKLPLVPRVIRGRKEIGRIFKACRREDDKP